MARILECVPNFSEGRDRGVVAALEAAVQSVPGVHLLDTHSDPDHHRSVLTFAGVPEATVEAALRAVRVARDRIDLREHRGAHPRFGAADVVPLVPVHGVPMEEAAALAQSLGARIASDLDIPVYFYEAAAVRDERRNLADVRRGGFERLGERMRAEPPDVGPASPHPSAGAVAVGARPPLVAFNVDLDTADVSVARDIAARIRASSGGLPAVKALGLALPSRGIVQVSMNLIEPRVTPPHVAFAAVEREAKRRGVEVLRGELVGLAPLDVLLAGASAPTGIPGLSGKGSLEGRLLEAVLRGSGP